MNWNLIKKYPKSYSKYDKEYRISSNSDIYGEHHPNQRVLYDFFDEQDIMIEVTYFSEDGRFDASIMRYGMPDGVYLFSTPYCKTRTEAEELAFAEAFKILEKK